MSKLFNETVKLEGTRSANAPRVSLSLRACVMDGSMDAPFMDSSASSDPRNRTIIVSRVALGLIVPQIGDIITLADNSRHAVKSVQPFYDREYILEVRSC